MRDAHLVAMIEQRQRVLEASLSEIAPRADDVGPDVDVHQNALKSADRIARHVVQTITRPARGSGDVKLTCVRFRGRTRTLRINSLQCGHRADRSSVYIAPSSHSGGIPPGSVGRSYTSCSSGTAT